MNNIGHTKAQVIAVAFAVVVGAAVGVWLPSGNAALGDTLGLPGDGMDIGAAARQASVCRGEDGERAFPREGISRI